ncbi:ArsO family NAD(P)H-dependent flavin-containing monooxygenase [uncultured Roseobacter sp.]|uniref:ArsO family NAD(P)H-dependent flavin-containing monooxygenase n=1 Tax=uncultured Roseobacter sp. TaxID=114847 RepID=UPI0026350C75|nr:ArsO family NAD(P)H-dependent flavin-containing monooxygenase [uncultured Roseobacter sp.]
MTNKTFDIIIIGGGQAGLSPAYFLRRTGLRFVILDDSDKPGGSWTRTWDSLRLFSPVDYSSIAGWQMPQGEDEYPHKDEFISYLAAYETRYDLPIERPVRVRQVSKTDDGLAVQTDKGTYSARVVVSATGTAQSPFLPDYDGRNTFEGVQIHSADYRNPTPFAGRRVAIVGAGNSAAQILAEVSQTADTLWITPEEPRFNPDDVDGRHIFGVATQRFTQTQSGDKPTVDTSRFSLGSIVMVESVRDARARGDVLHAVRPFTRLTASGGVWPDDSTRDFDAIIWCTGFQPNLAHLQPMLPVQDGKARTDGGPRALDVAGLWLVGYGGWTGYASATTYGVTKTARQAVREITEYLT